MIFTFILFGSFSFAFSLRLRIYQVPNKFRNNKIRSVDYNNYVMPLRIGEWIKWARLCPHILALFFCVLSVFLYFRAELDTFDAHAICLGINWVRLFCRNQCRLVLIFTLDCLLYLTFLWSTKCNCMKSCSAKRLKEKTKCNAPLRYKTACANWQKIKAYHLIKYESARNEENQNNGIWSLKWCKKMRRNAINLAFKSDTS